MVPVLRLTFIKVFSSLNKLNYFLFIDPPFAPRKLQVVEYNIDYVILSWEEPEFDGGSPINNYFVEKRDALMNIWSQAGKTEKDTRRLKVVNLYEGQSYYFRVCAENQCGRGPFVETLKPVTAKLPYGEL